MHGNPENWLKGWGGVLKTPLRVVWLAGHVEVCHLPRSFLTCMWHAGNLQGMATRKRARGRAHGDSIWTCYDCVKGADAQWGELLWSKGRHVTYISKLISYHSSSHITAHLIPQLISYHSSSHITAHLIPQLISYHSSSHITAHLISQLISYHISSLISYHSSSHITSLPLLLLQRLDHVPDMLHNSTRPLLAHCIA